MRTNKLLQKSLERDKQLRGILIPRNDWMEKPDIFSVLLVLFVLGTVLIAVNFFKFPLLDSPNVFFLLAVALVYNLTSKIKKLNQRIDTLIELFNDEIEERLAEKLRAEIEE